MLVKPVLALPTVMLLPEETVIEPPVPVVAALLADKPLAKFMSFAAPDAVMAIEPPLTPVEVNARLAAPPVIAPPVIEIEPPVAATEAVVIDVLLRATAPAVAAPPFTMIVPPLPPTPAPVADKLAAAAKLMPPLLPARPVFVTVIEPPEPVVPEFAVRVLLRVMAVTALLLLVTLIVPPFPVPTPAELNAGVTVNVPFAAALLLAFRLMVPPLPFVPTALTFIAVLAPRVSVRPAVNVTEPPDPPLPVPVADVLRPTAPPTAISPVAA